MKRTHDAATLTTARSDLLLTLPPELLDHIFALLAATDLHALGRALILTYTDKWEWSTTISVVQEAVPLLALMQRHLRADDAIWKRRRLERIRQMTKDTNSLLDPVIIRVDQQAARLFTDPLFVVKEFLLHETCTKCVLGWGQHTYFGGDIVLCTCCQHGFHNPHLLYEHAHASDLASVTDGLVLVGQHELRALCDAPRANGAFATRHGIRYISNRETASSNEYLLADIQKYRAKHRL